MWVKLGFVLPTLPTIDNMSSSQQPTNTITTIEELWARRQAEKEEWERKQKEEDKAFEEEIKRLEEEERRKREEEEWRRRLEQAEQDWLREKELEKARKEKKRKVVESEGSGNKAGPSGSNKKVSEWSQKREKITNSCFIDKSKNNHSQELTTLRAVCKGGGGLPQKSNRTGLQTVRREEGRVQLGGAAEENGEEGGEGGGEATDVVGA